MCRQSSVRVYKNFVRCKFTFQRLIFRLIYICFLYKLSVYYMVSNSFVTSFYIFETSNLPKSWSIIWNKQCIFVKNNARKHFENWRYLLYYSFRKIFRVLILFCDDTSRKFEVIIYHDIYVVIIRYATNIRRQICCKCHKNVLQCK